VQRLFLIPVLIFLLAPSYKGQSVTTEQSKGDSFVVEKSTLLSELQNLHTESTRLESPLARALAKAEIADAAWTLDQEWAKTLLRDAYELTFPDEEEQSKLRNKPAGAPPPPPTDTDRARGDVRNRVLSVAGRDKAFADQLAQLGARQLGSYEEHFRYASLASQFIKAGDTETASKYILQSINADPTQITAGASILELAARDRKAADNLILQYIGRLRTTPLSIENQSAVRTYVILAQMIFPNSNMLSGPRQILPPGPAVMREYVSYIIESMGAMEQREPGSVIRLRAFLLPIWPLLKQYGPELAGTFMELERLSRQPGGDATLPYNSGEAASRESFDKRVKDALDSGRPDDLTINLAISREEFGSARKMIDLLPDGAQKVELAELVNLREVISLAEKGNIVGAELLAKQLNKAVSVLQAYPLIMRKCAAEKNTPCVTNVFYEAVKQLKRADTTPYTPPVGIPTSAMSTKREADPVLLSLSKLVKAVAPVNDTLALDALEETVKAANSSEIDTGQGRIGFDIDIFKMLAPKNEARVRSAANGLKDQLRQIVALAVINQWKATELSKEIKANRQK